MSTSGWLEWTIGSEGGAARCVQAMLHASATTWQWFTRTWRSSGTRLLTASWGPRMCCLAATSRWPGAVTSTRHPSTFRPGLTTALSATPQAARHVMQLPGPPRGAAACIVQQQCEQLRHFGKLGVATSACLAEGSSCALRSWPDGLKDSLGNVCSFKRTYRVSAHMEHLHTCLSGMKVHTLSALPAAKLQENATLNSCPAD